MNAGTPYVNDTGNSAPLEPLLDALADITAWLDASDARYTVIGGVAASLLGRPRVTQDIDILLLLEEDEWASFLDSASSHGFTSRVADCLEFARRTRVFLLRHEATGVSMDIVLAGLPFEHEVIVRAQRVNVANTTVKVPTTEDLIVMKAVAGRPHDIGDIEGLLDAHVDVDWPYVLRWTGEFAGALDSSEIMRAIEGLRTKHRR
jgi:predicted nucleotidyltransferase